jgi:GxxExxY protein
MNGINGMINRIHEQASPENSLAKRVIGLAMEVQSTLGSGLLESLYVSALVIELRAAGISLEREKRFTVSYKDIEIGYFIADLVIDNQLIVEAKAVESLAIAHSLQLVNYLAISKIDFGLLLNFGPRKLEFKTKTRHYAAAQLPPNIHQ